MAASWGPWLMGKQVLSLRPKAVTGENSYVHSGPRHFLPVSWSFVTFVASGGSSDLSQALFLGFMEHLRSLALGRLPLLTDWLACKMTLCVYFSCSFITSCCSLQGNGALKCVSPH